MAHEMGHYVLNHGVKLVTYTGVLILLGFALTRSYSTPRSANGATVGASAESVIRLAFRFWL